MTRPLEFSKLEALGNDFMLVDARDQPFAPTPETVVRLADRHYGIGFDQLLILEACDDEACLARVNIHNSDGSTAEQCGNGMRAIALWLHERGELGDSCRIRTDGGPVALQFQNSDHITVTLAVPDFDPARISLEDCPHRFEIEGQPVEALGVSLGNPHLVVEWPEAPSLEAVQTLGRALSAHPQLIRGANVGLAHVTGGGRVELRVFERGAGPTRACGSGACAAAVALIRAGRVQSPVEIVQPGGALVINWDEAEQPVAMTGPARQVFEGTCPWPK